MIENELQRIQNHIRDDILILEQANISDEFYNVNPGPFIYAKNQIIKKLEESVNLHESMKRQWKY